MFKKTATALTIALSFTGTLFAGAPMGKEPIFDPFAKGMHELQIQAGSYFEFSHEPKINFADVAVRYGVMLTSPEGDGCLRGNFEFLGEAFGAVIFQGPGDGIAGLTLMLRYNFVQPSAKLVPYFQIGAGGAWNNAHNDASQRILGSQFTFNLQSAIGLRYFLNESVALTVEGGWMHLSNASLSDRNLGLNGAGGAVGVSWFF